MESTLLNLAAGAALGIAAQYGIGLRISSKRWWFFVVGMATFTQLTLRTLQ